MEMAILQAWVTISVTPESRLQVIRNSSDPELLTHSGTELLDFQGR